MASHDHSKYIGFKLASEDATIYECRIESRGAPYWICLIRKKTMPLEEKVRGPVLHGTIQFLV